MLSNVQVGIYRTALACIGLPYYSDNVTFVETDKQIEKMKCEYDAKIQKIIAEA